MPSENLEPESTRIYSMRIRQPNLKWIQIKFKTRDHFLSEPQKGWISHLSWVFSSQAVSPPSNLPLLVRSIPRSNEDTEREQSKGSPLVLQHRSAKTIPEVGYRYLLVLPDNSVADLKTKKIDNNYRGNLDWIWILLWRYHTVPTSFNTASSTATQIPLCRKTLGSNSGLLRLWQISSTLSRSHPHTRLDLIQSQLNLTHSRLDLIHSRLDLIHSRLDHIHYRQDLIHAC
jgi:hypothetical protein